MKEAKFRSCEVCGVLFEVLPKKGKQSICGSPECVTSRRRARRSGIKSGGLDKPTRDCVICGKKFPVHSATNCCSPECLREKKRRRSTDSYYRMKNNNPDFAVRIKKRRKERMANDSEFAEKMRNIWKRKEEKRKERMANDPEYAEKKRKETREWYARNAKRIQEARKERLSKKLAEMTDEELENYRVRLRKYQRKWLGKDKSSARRKAYGDEYRKRRRAERDAEKLAYDLAVAEAALAGVPLETILPHANCKVCGSLFHLTQKRRNTCSEACRKIVCRENARASRERLRGTKVEAKCVECGATFKTMKNRVVCSRECKLARKNKLRRKNRNEDSSTGREEADNCRADQQPQQPTE